MTVELVQGWTERINDTLESDGVIVNLTGMTVQLFLYDKRNNPVTYAGTVGIETANIGLVYFDPASADLLASRSPYHARWKVTAAGQVASFPSGRVNVWYVRNP